MRMIEEEILELLVEGAYVLEGLLMLLGSLAIALPVFLQPAMRCKKHFVVVAALAFTDAVNGYAYLASGIFRAGLHIQNTAHINNTTTASCWTNNPFRLAWGWADLASTLMLLSVSCDRLLSVAYPVWYLVQSTTFSYVYLIGPSYLIGLLDLAIAVYVVNNDETFVHNQVNRVCYLTMSYAPWHLTLHLNLMTGAAGTSVVLYGVLLAVYVRMKFIRTHRAGNQEHILITQRSAMFRRQQETQRRLTRTLAISAFCTLSLYVIPLQIDRILTDRLFFENCDLCHAGAKCLYIVANLNCLMNVFLFFSRHSELRKALKYTLKFRRMPLLNKSLI